MKYHIHFWQADQQGPGWLRVEQIQTYLNREYPDEVKATYSNYMDPRTWVTQTGSGNLNKAFDLTVHQRQYGDTQLYYFRYLQSQLKIPCIYEIDDYLHGISPSSPAYQFYQAPQVKQKVFENINAYLQEADALTVSTDYLKKMYTKYNPHIYVLPNSIDYEIFSEAQTQKPNHGDEIWLGWAGSRTHLADLQLIVDPVRKILREFPQTKLVLGGWDGYYTNTQGRQFYLWEGIPTARIITLPWVDDVEEYPKLLAQFDIGLAPLTDTMFNRCKSNLKYLEYVSCGAAVIASAVEPYAQTIQDGRTGLLVTTDKPKLAKAWYDAIKTLVVNQTLRLQLAEHGKRFAHQHFDIAVNIQQWHQAYQEILQRASSKPLN